MRTTEPRRSTWRSAQSELEVVSLKEVLNKIFISEHPKFMGSPARSRLTMTNEDKNELDAQQKEEYAKTLKELEEAEDVDEDAI